MNSTAVFKKLFVSLSILLLSTGLFGCAVRSAYEQKVSVKDIHIPDYSEAREFPFELHSEEYLLIRLNDMKVLYEKDADKEIYPASLTKVMTLDAVLHLAEDLKDTSYISYADIGALIEMNASIAGLSGNTDYTIEELLYALILPSGADAAIALENYAAKMGTDLIKEMNYLSKELGLDAHFENTTGLHDSDHVMSLNDLLAIYLDTLSYRTGREVLESLYYSSERDTYYSTVNPVNSDHVDVLGGKTGYTGMAGQCISILYRQGGRSYLLLLAGAQGSPGYGEYWHYEDAETIFERLY